MKGYIIVGELVVLGCLLTLKPGSRRGFPLHAACVASALGVMLWPLVVLLNLRSWPR